MFLVFIKTHGKSAQVSIVREYVNGNDSSSSVKVMIISGQRIPFLYTVNLFRSDPCWLNSRKTVPRRSFMTVVGLYSYQFSQNKYF